MRSSPGRGIDVFDFNEDDEVNHSLAGKYSGKLKSPSSDDHALLTRDSLDCVSPGTAVQRMEISGVPCVDVDEDDCEPSCGNATSLTSPDKAKENIVSVNKCYDNSLQEKPSSHEQCSDLKSDHNEASNIVSEAEKRHSEPKASCLVKLQLNRDNSDSSSEIEPIDATSDADDSMDRSSSPSPPSAVAEHNDLLNGCAMDLCSGDMEMDGMNMTVVLYPDYATYRDTYCAEPHLIFSDSCIKIIGSTTYAKQEAFDFECELDDVINIECQLFQRVETVMIKLRVIAKDEFEDVGTVGTSGIEELKILVVEPNWCKKQEEITSLHHRYLTLWKHVQDTDMDLGTDGEDSPRLRRYFPVFGESFEEVIYPKGDADAVSISKRDVDLLQPETFINDTIIDFYIKYLKNQIQPEERHKYHFFNSFFFRKLADLDKDPSSASDGTAAFQRVRKWTRKVDLFGKEFVFIPINFSLHWSLVVLCHPGEVATFTDEDIDKSLKVPCILHMDSIKGNHAGLKHLIQSYLWEEWKERKKETSEEVSSRFHNLRFVSLELPQQENSFDCGLFLLHYLERFVAEVPDYFSPFKIEKSSNFLNSNWFPPTEASLKRALIQRLIFELLKNRSSQEVSSPVSSDDELIPESNVNGGAQFLSASSNPGPSCQQNNVSTSQACQGIELTLLSPSSMRNSQCVNDSGLVVMDLFNPGGSSGSLMEQCQSFDQKAQSFSLNGAISTLEEDPETGEEFMFGETAFHQLQLITPQTGGIPYPSKEYGSDAFGMGISLQAEHGDVDCSREPSICASDDSSDVVAITEPFPCVEHSSPIQKEKNEEQKSPPFEHVECVKQGLASASHELAGGRSPPLENFEFVKEQDTLAAAEASQNCDLSQSGNENGFSFLSSLEYHDAVVVTQDSVVAESDVQMIEDDDDKVGQNSYVQQPVDKTICSGDNVHSLEDGLLSLGSIGVPATGLGDNTQIVDEDGLVGLDLPWQKQVDNEIGSGDNGHMVVDGSVVGQQKVDIATGLGDNTQIVKEYGAVSLDSPGHEPVSTAMGLGDNTQIVDEDDKVGLDSPGPKPDDNVVGSGDDSEIFEDASACLDSPGLKPVDNVICSGYNSQNFEDASVGLDSPGQNSVDNGLGGNSVSPNFEDASMDLDPLRDQSGIVKDLGDVQVIEDGLAGPDSPVQHPAKRQRLLPSVEDESNAVGSAAED